MNIPSYRISFSKKNVQWLLKNLGVRNSEHPQYNEAMESLKAIKDNKAYLN